MTLPEISALLATTLFAAFATFLLLKERRQKQIIWKEEQKKEQELVSKDEFTHMIVHELRAPTTAIKDAALLLKSSFESLDEKQKNTLLTMISDQSQKMLNQISTLLDAAKLQAGKLTLEKTLTDIQVIIDQQMQVFEPIAQSKQIKLVSDIEPNLPKIWLDSVRIGQVINNLVSNSLKFSDRGSITICAKKNDGFLFISVSDTGHGIAKEKQKELFLKFHQVSNLPTEPRKQQVTKGTGLGLYIVKGIISAHGGSVLLDSEENKGTTITFTLPFAEPSTPSHQ